MMNDRPPRTIDFMITSTKYLIDSQSEASVRPSRLLSGVLLVERVELSL